MGSVFARYYKDLADEIVILSRRYKAPDENIVTRPWDGKTEGDWVSELEGTDMLINLCGKNVNCRYTAKNKAEIFASRLLPTALLGKVIARLNAPPKLWVNITSATIYRHAVDRPQDELNGNIGAGFSVEVCKQWEEAFFTAYTPQTRKVALRMGIVMGTGGGAFPRLLNLVRAGMGGKQGNGEQYVSWIHERDAAACTEFLLAHEDIDGVINCTAPNPEKNAAMMQALRLTDGIPVGLPVPEWFLSMGAAIIGTETELVLKSRWVLPKRLSEAGYRFQFSRIEQAFDDILHNKN